MQITDEQDRYKEEDIQMGQAPSLEEVISQEAPAYAENNEISLLDGEGNFSPNWYERYESLTGDSKALSKFKTPEALAKSYASLERMKKYPGIEDQDKMAAFRRLVGLPDKPEEYSLSRPEGADDHCWNQGFADEIAKVAYHYGVPPMAMEALGETYLKAHQKALQDIEMNEQQQYEEADRVLQEEWGAGYETGMHQVATAVQKLSDRAGVASEMILDDPAIGSNPAFIRMMREAARLMDEAPLKGAEAPVVSPAQEAKRIESDPTHPLHEAYMNHNHPNHRYANEMYDKLAFGDR